MPDLAGLAFHPLPGWRKTLSFLFVRHAFERQSLFAQFGHEGVGVQKYMILIPLDRGRFVVVQSCSTFSDCRQLSTSLNAEFQKTAKICFFVSPPEGDKIKRSRRILTRKRALWVNYSTPDLALIGKRGSVQEPPNVKRCPKLWFLATGNRHNEHIQLKIGV